MAEQLDPKEIVNLEGLALSNMWEVAALIEVLEKKGLLTKQDILDAIRELRQVKMAAKGFRGFPKWVGGKRVGQVRVAGSRRSAGEEAEGEFWAPETGKY